MSFSASVVHVVVRDVTYVPHNHRDQLMGLFAVGKFRKINLNRKKIKGSLFVTYVYCENYSHEKKMYPVRKDLMRESYFSIAESYFSIAAQELSMEHGMYQWAVLIGQSASEGLAGQFCVKIIIIIID